MKKFILIFIITIFSPISILANELQELNEPYKVLKVIDGDTIYLDFNKNNIADSNERVRINGIDAFEITASKGAYYQMWKYNLSLEEVLGLGYFGYKFAQKELLYKYVKVAYLDSEKKDIYNRYLMIIHYDKNKDYSQEILKAGLAKIYTKSKLSSKLKKYENNSEFKKNTVKTKYLNLAYLNLDNNKVHKINCKYIDKIYRKQLINLPTNKKNIIYAQCCFDIIRN